MAFVELLGRTNFSFLRGASHPEEMVERAHALGLEAVGLCDRDGLYGSVRAWVKAREIGQRLVVGAELGLARAGEIVERRGSWASSGRRPSGDERPTLALLVEDHEGYTNLCHLLTRAHEGLPKGESVLEPEWLEEHHRGLTAVVLVEASPATVDDALIARLHETFGDHAVLAAHRCLDGLDGERTARVVHAAERHALRVVASARPAYHHASRKPLADVVHCIRTGCTLDAAGTALGMNAEAHLRGEGDVRRLFADRPEWVEATSAVAERLRFDLGELRYRFPCRLEPGETADARLGRLTWEGARQRYPAGLPEKVRRQIEKELGLVEKLGVAPYFLSTWEVVEIARARRILCQGRGSAANSAVCYVLGITAVDPARSNLLFERFMSAERNEPPDIDIDFEHERREEVIQEIYARHGRDRAAMVSEVISYRGKSALREVGKVFGLSLEQIDRLSGAITHWDTAEIGDRRLEEYGFDVGDERLRRVVMLARAMEGFPRHLSIHVGGFVLSATPLCEVAPVEPARREDRTVVPWDKDDLEALGFFKIDLLGLGMLTAVRKALALVEADGGLPALEVRGRSTLLEAPPTPCGKPADVMRRVMGTECGAPEPSRRESHGVTSDKVAISNKKPVLPPGALAAREVPSAPGPEVHMQAGSATSNPLEQVPRIPPEDPAVYEMIARADTVGVFQIESRAQMAMLPRLRPECFYDLVIEVAIVRPGPIQGGMVHPYLRRRSGEEPVTSPHPDLWPILERTLGVPLFQEQVMQISITGAGYTGGQADQLRRDMAAWRKSGRLLRHRQRLLDGFAAKGISRRFGEALFEQIKGFGDYGFPESHAASFALIVYSSAWLKCHFPAHFTCALINSQPMGFYSTSSLVQDAKKHGVEVRDVSVEHSEWDCTLEGPASARALRLGFRVVKGAREGVVKDLVRERAVRPFTSVHDLVRRVGLKKDDVEGLAEAGALEPLVPGRRHALWKARAPRVGGLFRDVDPEEPAVTLPELGRPEQMLLDYGRKGLSLGDHPLTFLRSGLAEQGVVTTARLQDLERGTRASVAGLVLSRQQPGTASGVVFVTLEDETGVANLILYARVFEEYRLAARHATILRAWGKVERHVSRPRAPTVLRSEPVPIVHLIVERVQRLDVPGRDVRYASRDFH